MGTWNLEMRKAHSSQKSRVDLGRRQTSQGAALLSPASLRGYSLPPGNTRYSMCCGGLVTMSRWDGSGRGRVPPSPGAEVPSVTLQGSLAPGGRLAPQSASGPPAGDPCSCPGSPEDRRQERWAWWGPTGPPTSTWAHCSASVFSLWAAPPGRVPVICLGVARNTLREPTRLGERGTLGGETVPGFRLVRSTHRWARAPKTICCLPCEGQ